MGSKASTFDEISQLPEKDRNEVIDSMSDADVQAFLEHMKTRAPTSPAATPPAEEQPAQLPAELRQPETPSKTTAGGPPLPGQPFLTGNVPIEEKQGVPTGQRLVAQNFGNDPFAVKGYIEKQNPNLDVEVYQSPGTPTAVKPFATPDEVKAGKIFPDAPPPHYKPTEARVIVRPKGAADKPWQVIDPQTGLHPISDFPEMLKDVGDTAYDIPAGLVQNAASALGGLGGASLGMMAGPAAPVAATAGAYTGAGVAGGTTAAGLEYLRQKLGQWAGIPQEIDKSKIGDATIGGLAAPFIFGTGATPTSAAKMGVPFATQRGIPMRLAEEGTAQLSSFMSGIPTKAIREARDLLPEIKQVESQGEAGVVKLANDAQQEARGALYGKQQKLGSEISRVLDEAGQKVDMRSTRAQLDALIQNLEGQRGSRSFTANRERELDYAKSLYNDLFLPKPPPEVTKRMTALQNLIDRTEKAQTDLIPHAVTPEQRMALVQTNRGLANAQNELDTLKKYWSTPPDYVSAPEAIRIKSDLQDLSLARVNGDRYGGNKSGFDKAVIGHASRAGKELNDAIGTAVGNAEHSFGGKGIKDLWSQYGELQHQKEMLAPFLDDSAAGEKRSFSLLSNLGNRANTIQRKYVKDLDNEFNTSVLHKADIFNAMKTFSDPANTAISGFGTTGTERGNRAREIGGILGGLMGLGLGKATGISPYWSTGAGVAAGGAMGRTLTTPAMLRRYMNVGNAFRNASGFVTKVPGLELQYTNPLGAAGIESAWEHMREK